MTMNCTTLLVEDHPLMRETLSEFINGLDNVEIVAAVATGDEALEFCSRQEPCLALIDVSLPKTSGLELLREMRARHPNVVCVMLSAHQEITYIRRALNHGAQGYVVKGNPSELVDAIHEVIHGKTYLSQSARDKLAATSD